MQQNIYIKWFLGIKYLDIYTFMNDVAQYEKMMAKCVKQKKMPLKEYT
jgi:hypothetical protein